MTGSELSSAIKKAGKTITQVADETGYNTKNIRIWIKYGVPFYAVASLKRALGINDHRDDCLLYTCHTSSGCRFGIRD